MVRVQRARVASATNPSFATALTANDYIAVTGIYDLISPEVTESYRVRLTDWDSSAKNESLELGVWRRATDNEVVISFRKGIVGAGFTVLEELALSSISNILDFDQIFLALSNDRQNPSALFDATIVLMDSLDISNTQTIELSTQGTMFNNRAWVRPSFIATQRVPVPATLALLGLGLAGIGYKRRKQGKAA